MASGVAVASARRTRSQEIVKVIGTSLGPYKIIEQLGKGGMGEVYLGEDTRLGRKVAIKVLAASSPSARRLLS